jgi:hypothetical protein
MNQRRLTIRAMLRLLRARVDAAEARRWHGVNHEALQSVGVRAIG